MAKPRTRGNGEGTVWQNANGTWTAQVSTPYGRPSKTFAAWKEAVVWSTAIKNEINTGEYLEPSTMSFGDWWDVWTEVFKRTSVSQASMDSYAYSCKRLKKHIPGFWASRMSTLSHESIQRALNALHDSGLSDRTCNLTLVHIKDCLGVAVEEKKIHSNPSQKVMPIYTHLDVTNKTPDLSEEAFDQLIADVTRPPKLNKTDGKINHNDLHGQAYRDVLLFIAHTSVRRGEACALTWDSVDFKTKEATIRKSRDAQRRESNTKNRAEKRVPLTDEVIHMLRRRKFIGHAFVFSTPSDKPISPRHVLKVMQRTTGTYVHVLRHTYITRAAQRGVPIKTLQEITGLKTVKVLLDVYTHVSSAEKAEAANVITASCKSTANTT